MHDLMTCDIKIATFRIQGRPKFEINYIASFCEE